MRKAASMGKVIQFDDHASQDFSPLDTGRWRSFAVAYIDEEGAERCIVYTRNVTEAKRLLRTALIQLEKKRQR